MWRECFHDRMHQYSHGPRIVLFRHPSRVISFQPLSQNRRHRLPRFRRSLASAAKQILHLLGNESLPKSNLVREPLVALEPVQHSLVRDVGFPARMRDEAVVVIQDLLLAGAVIIAPVWVAQSNVLTDTHV